MCTMLGSSSLLLACVVAPLVAGTVVRTRSCPLSTCQNANNVDAVADSFLEISSERSAVAAKAQTKGCGQLFTPAHFTCSSCDVQSCSGCKNIVCDLSKCIGKFFTQECWCTKPLNPAVEKIFCDSDCSGGLCNTGGLTCKTRESQCKPWWWCKLSPPKDSSFLQQMTQRQRQGACAKRESAQHLNERLQKSMAQLRSGAPMKRQINDFDFQPGQWVGESALLPQPDEDPVTLRQFAAGFIVLDGNTASGGYFKNDCFCYDKFLYLRGGDPKTSEFQCDAGCGQGPCAGKTCGKEPPPPLPAPAPPPPVDPLLQEMKNEAMLRNYGTQMSPVT